MRIEHIALWVTDLEAMKDFYVRSFGGSAGERYNNARTGFSSYFIQFHEGARLELMQRPDIAAQDATRQSMGYAHMAFSVGTALEVERKTEALTRAGVQLLSAPRLTGDNYYESVVQDPEGNRIEITI